MINLRVIKHNASMADFPKMKWKIQYKRPGQRVWKDYRAYGATVLFHISNEEGAIEYARQIKFPGLPSKSRLIGDKKNVTLLRSGNVL